MPAEPTPLSSLPDASLASGVRAGGRPFGAAELAGLAETLSIAEAGLLEIPDGALLAAWDGALEELADRSSPTGAALRPALCRGCRLSPAGLEAGLATVLGGARGTAARELARAARGREPGGGLVVLVLAANLPALAVQPLLPALLLRRPVLIKSPTDEPFFAPALVDALCRRLPALRRALAALTWRGGDEALEEAAFARATRVLAYGGGEAMAGLAERAGEKLVAHGPKLSLAIVGGDIEPASVAEGLARDVALFDQRGCLSVQAVYSDGDAQALAAVLAAALARRAEAWPGGPDDAAASAARQLRDEATMRGLWVADLPLADGTVIVDPEPDMAPSPGARTVRVHPVADLAALPEILAPWRGHLQGIALAGTPKGLVEPLRALRVSRFAPPGELQQADATWPNGGTDPLEALTGSPIPTT